MGFVDVAAFLMRYDDMMEYSFGYWENQLNGEKGLGFRSVNVGETEIKGVEVSVNGQGNFSKNTKLNILMGYTYMNSQSLEPDSVYTLDANGNPLTYNSSSSDASILKYRYKHIAKFDAELTHKKTSLGVSLRYNNLMKNIDKIFAAEAFSAFVPGIIEAREELDGGDFIIDLRSGYQLTDEARIGFIVNNLLNREYMSRPANMMPPRTFAMQLALKI